MWYTTRSRFLADYPTVIDPFPVLVAALQRGEALWPPTADGHFQARGQELLAELVNSVLSASSVRR